MKHHLFHSLCVHLLLISVFSGLFGDISSSDFSSLSPYNGDSEVLARTTGRSLLSLPSKSSSTALIAALDGNIQLVENNSMRVIWSFDSGSPIYTSYQAPVSDNIAKEDASESSRRFFIDCGDDWDLYMHSEHFGEVKLSMSIEDFVKSTPYVSEDGAVTIGSRKATVFEIEPLSGKLIRSHKSSDSASTFVNDDEKSVINTKGLNDNGGSKDLLKTGLNPVDPRLHITRTDYSLQSFFPGSEIVSWSMTVAEIGASLLCPDIENSLSGAPLSFRNSIGSEIDFDFSMPLSCQSKGVVFRQRNHVILESSRFERQLEAQNMNNMLPLSGENLMLPSEPIMDKSVGIKPEMLPAPTLNVIIPRETDESRDQSKDRETMVPLQPLLELNKSRTDHFRETIIYYVGLLNRLLERPMHLAIYAIIFSIILVILGIYCKILVTKKLFSNQNPSLPYSKIASSKKKKLRKRGKNNCNVEENDLLISTEIEDGIMPIEGNLERWFRSCNSGGGGVNGRRIGKLFVSNTEIAKGSNGTVVLEGIYEGRPVAVKRLVQAHHDVAFKEVQNLIVSDQHPNIVRWYGVEYDRDFVYLSLERCTCSLDDLLRANSNLSQKLESVKNYMPDFPLWKASGHPSSLLLKLMRDIVSGLGHLHDLGIIHRDLKPQNVLIIKDRTLCGKLSDMGISKRLLGDMSSLGHQATGCGSSGWQAPEQLLHGRQTRAVDLFSLGCVLFFSITGGRHPFGDRYERDANILKNQMNLFLVEFIPEAVDLISCLLNPIPELRLKAWEVLKHPLFWNSETRLSFLRDTSDRVELENRETESGLLMALESVAQVALGAKWDEKIEPIFIANVGMYRRYKYDSVRDLLRLMRNKMNHYRELPDQIQELVGPIPDGFDGYFATRFPRLLIQVYKVMYRHCSKEEGFQKYFHNQHLIM